jgi:hypothetical protein
MLVSGCARQVYYYYPYQDYATPSPEFNGDDPDAYGYPYGYGPNAGPYAYGGAYVQQVPTSSSNCWEPLRGRMPCGGTSP